MVHIPLPLEQIEAYCKKWHIATFSIFGSALRDDFRPDSDIDVLVTFEPGHRISFSNRVEMMDEIAAILGRKVDLIDRKNLERSQNYIRKGAILGSAEMIYAAG